jgi:protein required for attachment to host cells
MKLTWILVANKTNARLFTAATPSSGLTEVEDFTHAESRLHDRDLTTDLPGRIKGESGMGAHAFEQPTDPKKHEEQVFAHELAKFLEKGLNDGNFEQLLLVAEPSFLGLIREELSDAVKKTVCFELDKNLVKSSIDDICAHLPEFLPSL